MTKEGLFTTVVGSFPLENNSENMERAFKDQFNMGISYPCYPQLYGDMNAQFLDPLTNIVEGFEKVDDNFYLYNDFKVPDQPLALEYGEFIVDFLKKNPEVNTTAKGTKACLTGPFTLACEIQLKAELGKGINPQFFNEPRAIRLDFLIEKLAEIMKAIGKAYNNMGIDIISMDEPMLGLLVGRKSFFYPEEFYIKTLNTAISGIQGISSIHVCGRISPKLRDILLQTNVKIMDHEFRTNEKNFNTFQREHFEGTDKYLAVGSIETKPAPVKDGGIENYVEEISFLKDYYKKVIAQYGKENVVIKPDCGFGPLLGTFGQEFGYKIAMTKLERMVSALDEIR